MKKSLARLLSIILTLTMVISFTACGDSSKSDNSNNENKTGTTAQEDSKSKEQVELKLLINNTDEGVKNDLDYVMANISKELPGVKVELDMTPGDAQTFETKVRTMISAGGEGLDVWWERGGSWAVPVLKANGALVLDDYLNELGYWDMVIPSAKLPNDDGKIYAVPFEDIFFELMFYNAEIFKGNNLQVPKNTSELKKVVEVLKSKNIIPIACAGKDGWPSAMMIEGLAYSMDPEITKKIVEGKAKFSDEPYAAGAKIVKELMDMGAFSKNVALTDYGEALKLFETGKAAMMVNGSWTLPGSYKNMNGKCDYFYYPVIDGGNASTQGQNVAGGVKKNAGMMVYSGTKHPKEAVQLAVAVSKLKNMNAYVNKGNPFVVYNAEKLGWKSTSEFGEPIKRLAQEMSNYKFVFGFVQDVMPSSAGTKGVMESTSKFMTNSAKYTVEAYLADMDKAAAEK